MTTIEKTVLTIREIRNLEKKYGFATVFYEVVPHEERNNSDENRPLVAGSVSNDLAWVFRNKSHVCVAIEKHAFKAHVNNAAKLISPFTWSNKMMERAVFKAMLSGEETIYDVLREGYGRDKGRAIYYKTIEIPRHEKGLGNVLITKYYDVGSGGCHCTEERWNIATGKQIPYSSYYGKERVLHGGKVKTVWHNIDVTERHYYADLVSGQWPETMKNFI